MYTARWIIVSILLILLIGVTYSPFANDEFSQVWRDVRPTVLGSMDSIYATARNFVAGSEPADGVDDDAPGVDFDIISTMDGGGSFVKND
jgi:hypothetical protein